MFVNPSKTVARIEPAIAGNGDNAASQQAVQTPRHDVIAPIARRLPGATIAVTGETAGTHDSNESMKQHAPLVFGFVLGLAFLLLLLSFRSIMIPIVSILLNLLSVGAAYGRRAWRDHGCRFQELVGSGLGGLRSAAQQRAQQEQGASQARQAVRRRPVCAA